MDFNQLKQWSEQFDDVLSGKVAVGDASDEVRNAIAIISYNMASQIMAQPKSERKSWFERLPDEWRQPIKEIGRVLATGQTT